MYMYNHIQLQGTKEHMNYDQCGTRGTIARESASRRSGRERRAAGKAVCACSDPSASVTGET